MCIYIYMSYFFWRCFFFLVFGFEARLLGFLLSGLPGFLASAASWLSSWLLPPPRCFSRHFRLTVKTPPKLVVKNHVKTMVALGQGCADHLYANGRGLYPFPPPTSCVFKASPAYDEKSCHGQVCRKGW